MSKAVEVLDEMIRTIEAQLLSLREEFEETDQNPARQQAITVLIGKLTEDERKYKNLKLMLSGGFL